MTNTDISPPPLSAARLADLAHERIRAMILSGKIGMGERLVEAQLARDFGISRAPVREAMRRLIEDGLVQEQPRIGATVCDLTGDDIVDIYNVRLPLEASAIEIATLNGMDVAPLRQAIADMAEAATHENRLAVTEAELSFHAAIFDATQNKVMIHIFNILRARLTLAMLFDNSAFSTLDDVANEHLPLLDIVQRGDAKGASIWMLGHIVSSVRPLIEKLGGNADRLRIPAFFNVP
ncbi:GntR family transcriptional regulator [Martelella alba]|uniref:GntR family transcriptional regulator n=1 Tax=Martelella alba TaxID=2590451 RepID=A0ABY2SLS6_9HYPH|nr:GntR family transcriptional regulator [Martelella alba]TKI05280.1 GntR family transcriptional regulator [Martelella alba]